MHTATQTMRRSNTQAKGATAQAEGPRGSVHAQAFAFKWEQFKM
jgi:hypothetical protein